MQQPRPVAPAPPPGERRSYVEGRFGQIHVRRTGGGRPTLLLHQSPWTSVQYRNAGPLLAAAGLETIAADTPGMGFSDPAPHQPSIDDYAAAMGDLIDGLGLEAVNVVGHHTGALTAARLAARGPGRVARLVLHGAPLYRAEERAQRQGGMHTEQTLSPDGRHFTDRWAYLTRLAGHEMSLEARHTAVLAYFANGPQEWHGHAAAYAYDLEADVDAIACPTLVVASRDDPIYAHGRRLAERRPGFAYAECSGGSEGIFDRPAEWVAAVAPFLTA